MNFIPQKICFECGVLWAPDNKLVEIHNWDLICERCIKVVLNSRQIPYVMRRAELRRELESIDDYDYDDDIPEEQEQLQRSPSINIPEVQQPELSDDDR